MCYFFVFIEQSLSNDSRYFITCCSTFRCTVASVRSYSVGWPVSLLASWLEILVIIKIHFNQSIVAIERHWCMGEGGYARSVTFLTKQSLWISREYIQRCLSRSLYYWRSAFCVILRSPFSFSAYLCYVQLYSSWESHSFKFSIRYFLLAAPRPGLLLPVWLLSFVSAHICPVTASLINRWIRVYNERTDLYP